MSLQDAKNILAMTEEEKSAMVQKYMGGQKPAKITIQYEDEEPIHIEARCYVLIADKKIAEYGDGFMLLTLFESYRVALTARYGEEAMRMVAQAQKELELAKVM